MKELEPKHKIERHEEVDQQKEHKLIGSIILKPGLKLWGYDWETGELDEIDIKRQIAIGLDGKEKKMNKVFANTNIYYIQALNRKNANRKVIRRITSNMQRG